MGPSSELRVYTIADGMLEEFVRRWETGVRPLRESRGFRVEGAWTVPAQGKFVWILSRGGNESFQQADAAYYASPERAALQPDPAELIVEAQTYMLVPLDTPGR